MAGVRLEALQMAKAGDYDDDLWRLKGRACSSYPRRHPKSHVQRDNSINLVVHEIQAESDFNRSLCHPPSSSLQPKKRVHNCIRNRWIPSIQPLWVGTQTYYSNYSSYFPPRKKNAWFGFHGSCPLKKEGFMMFHGPKNDLHPLPKYLAISPPCLQVQLFQQLGAPTN